MSTRLNAEAEGSEPRPLLSGVSIGRGALPPMRSRFNLGAPAPPAGVKGPSPCSAAYNDSRQPQHRRFQSPFSLANSQKSVSACAPGGEGWLRPGEQAGASRRAIRVSCSR